MTCLLKYLISVSIEKCCFDTVVGILGNNVAVINSELSKSVCCNGHFKVSINHFLMHLSDSNLRPTTIYCTSWS